MQQRGYDVQILPLQSMASMSGAQYIFRNLPTPNTTAFQLVLNVRSNCWKAPAPVASFLPANDPERALTLTRCSSEIRSHATDQHQRDGTYMLRANPQMQH